MSANEYKSEIAKRNFAIMIWGPFEWFKEINGSTSEHHVHLKLIAIFFSPTAVELRILVQSELSIAAHFLFDTEQYEVRELVTSLETKDRNFIVIIPQLCEDRALSTFLGRKIS